MQHATSEIILTLDSDSVLPENSIRNLVAPFILEENTGAVAGSVRVFNRFETLITRMLGVRYILGFDYIRAYQSELKTVFCCPGAFSAYKRSVIEPHLDAWLNQTFLGNRCTNGDDHALTNVVLSEERDVRYQSNAPVFTIVPTKYRPLCRMYTRWARSNIRESWRYLKFSVRRARARGEFLAWVDSIVHALHIPARLYLLPFSWFLLLSSMDLLVRSLAVATIVSAIYALFFLRSEKSTESIYGVIYGWFALLTLQWIYPVAAATVSQNNWMTRNIERKKRAEQNQRPIASITATSISLVDPGTANPPR
jgi:hyaluronan synthase